MGSNHAESSSPPAQTQPIAQVLGTKLQGQRFARGHLQATATIEGERADVQHDGRQNGELLLRASRQLLGRMCADFQGERVQELLSEGGLSVAPIEDLTS